MSALVVVLEVARIEAAHLAGLVVQFAELLDGAESAGPDPAIDRLVPDAYADHDDAREFRELTERDLLARRRDDAAAVLSSLSEAADIPDDADDAAMLETVEIGLEPAAAQAWLRTLAAIRLVLATRLGITEPQDHDPEDPRFGVYEWLGYRLDGLVGALERDD